MSRASDRAKWNDKNRGRTNWGGPGGSKGIRASPSKQFKNRCDSCGGALPCNDADCRRSAGKNNYDARKQARKEQYIKNRAKKVKKASKKGKAKKKGCMTAIVVMGGSVAAGGYGVVEVILRLVG